MKVDLTDWNIIEQPNAAKIVQCKYLFILARTYQEKISTFTSSDRWFQLTCRFSNAKG